MRYIYVYREADTGVPVYVGSAFDVKERDRVHCKRKDIPFDRELQRRGRNAFTLHTIDSVVAECADKATALSIPLENEWMNRLFTFRTDHGFNFTRSHKRPDTETISAATKRAWKNPLLAPKMKAAQQAGHSVKSRAMQGAALSKTMSNPEFKERNKARRNDPAFKSRQSETAKSRWADPDVRARQSAAIKAAHSTPDAKIQHMNNALSQWSDPEIRNRMCASMSAAAQKPKRIAIAIANLKNAN